MKKFANLFVQDLKVTIRSGFHYAIIGLAVVFILLTHFLIPQSIETTTEEIFFDNTSSKAFENYFIQNGADPGAFYNDFAAFENTLDKSGNTAGIMISGYEGSYKFEIFTKSAIPPKTENIIIAALDTAAAAISGQEMPGAIEYEILKQGINRIPFNKALLPVFITFEAIMMGFILIAVLVFQEKHEGSIRAYRISPSKTVYYIFSKTAVLTIIGLLYGFFTTVFITGFNADFLALLLIIFIASIFINFLGLALSVFFNNISEFLIVSLTALALIQLPLVSYFNPSFSPQYLKYIPSYPVIFGVRQALFFPESRDYLWPMLLILLIETIIVFGFCYLAVRIKLMKSGGAIVRQVFPKVKGKLQ